jgi:asparagine synthetase B (glutamine-hydrolysing)
MRLADIEVWSLPNLLAFADRNSMAHSVETRLPFLDPDVATLALAMPGDVLYRGGWTKWPLRAHLAGRGVPEAAWRRGKRWFDLPSDSWLDTSLRPAIDAFAAQPHEQWESFIAGRDLRGYVTELRGSRAPSAAGDLMVVLALERFFRVWFGRAEMATSTSIGARTTVQV